MNENEQTDGVTSATEVTPLHSPSTDLPTSRPGAGLTVGGVLNNRYAVERELGRGGIGAVYLARDQQLLSKPVVVKVLLDESLRNEWVVQKFRQEMEALTRIEHPGVIGILDAGETPGGSPYIVMQYVEGETLRAALRPGEGMELGRAADVMRQVCEALAAAHDAGVLHRDLKPENVMLRRGRDGREQAKLIDFGIAKVKDSVVAPATVTSLTVGTVAYMSPEQLDARPVTAASDVYALGIIAYEMVTGRKPFMPESLFQLLEMQREGVKVRPKDLRRGLPEAAQAAILKALAYDPRDRYQSADEFGTALWRALAGAVGGLPLEAATLTGPDPSRDALHGATSENEPLETRRSAMEMGHVLFTDIVGYSKLPIDEQTKVLRQLQQVIRETAEFARAQAAGRLIRLPTGDGMALVFFGDPEAPVRCALEVAKALRSVPQVELRMGVHSGPVEKITDVNDKENVAGAGINMAQRVMDCGDDGHILLSKRVADDLGQYSHWRPYLHDLGEAEVKHGVRVHVVNLYGDGWGNPEPPAKFKGKRFKVKTQGHSERKVPAPLLLGAAAAVVLLTVVAGVLLTRPQRTNPVISNAGPSAPAAAPARTLNYWVEVQKFRNGKPDKEPFRLANEMVFQVGDHVWLNFDSPQPGHLYLINEGPEPANGLPQYNVLFPTPTSNNNSSAVAASQAVRVPGARGFVIDDERGTEKVWVVWSARPVDELEAVAKEVVTSEQRGVVSKPDQIRLLQSFIADHTRTSPQESKDEAQKLTTVKGPGDLIVSLRKLEHY